MDLSRLAGDAGQLVNRAVQFTEETLGQAEKTELHPDLEQLLSRAEATKTRTDQIVSQTEALLQPNPGARLEDRLYERLDWSAPPRPRALEVLGESMTQAGLEIGPNTPYGTALVRCGEAQKVMGEAERKFIQSANIHFLTPLRSFSEGEYGAMQDERRMLVNKRLDLDIAKTRLRKAHEADAESRNLNANPLDSDYVAHVSYMFSFLRVKWLKMWAQEISQAEMELRICQSLFDRQSEVTRRLLEGIGAIHTNHMRSLVDFVEAQSCYYAQCHQHARELQKELTGIPAVLCSNNWQATASDVRSQPPTSDGATAQPAGLKQVNPVPVTIHRLPDSNRGPADAETEGSWVPEQPSDQTNSNNNNNNTSSTTHRSTESQVPTGSTAESGPMGLSSAAGDSTGAIAPPASNAARSTPQPSAVQTPSPPGEPNAGDEPPGPAAGGSAGGRPDPQEEAASGTPLAVDGAGALPSEPPPLAPGGFYVDPNGTGDTAGHHPTPTQTSSPPAVRSGADYPQTTDETADESVTRYRPDNQQNDTRAAKKP